jgi:hypothetical protein
MRKNTLRVFRAWQVGHHLHLCRSISTNGEEIFSYNTRILWRTDSRSARLVLDLKNYSPTTSRQQNDLLFLLRSAQLLSRTTTINAPDPPAEQLAMFDPKEGG